MEELNTKIQELHKATQEVKGASGMLTEEK